jgi:hypothetical protein
MILQDLKKVSHHSTPQSRKGFSADRDYLTLIPLAVAEDDPQEDIKSFA